MVGGRGVKLDSASGIREAELFLCVDVDAGDSEANVRQASSIEPEWLPLEHLQQRDDRFMHPTQGSVITRRRTYWLDLVIEETPIATPLDEATAELLASAAITQWHPPGCRSTTKGSIVGSVAYGGCPTYCLTAACQICRPLVCGNT